MPAPDHVQVADMKVVGNNVYWCGRDTSLGKGVVGFFDAQPIYDGASGVDYYMIQYPNMTYMDTNNPFYGQNFIVNNIFKIEVLEHSSSFPHLAVLCDLACGNTTTTGVGEVISLPPNPNILCYTYFTAINLEQFYDMTLTDNYLLTISAKGPGSDHFPYIVRYFTCQPYFLATLGVNDGPAFHTHNYSTEYSGPSLIEALTGDDFIVAYHSRNDNTPTESKVYLDLFTGVNFAANSATTTISASIEDASLLLTRNKMYDLAYDAHDNTFWLLHEVDTSHMQQIIRMDSLLLQATAYSLTNTCIQSIDYNNTLGLATASGFNTSSNKLIEIGKQAGWIANCMSARTSKIEHISSKTLPNTDLPINKSQGNDTVVHVQKPISSEHYKYNCSKK